MEGIEFQEAESLKTSNRSASTGITAFVIKNGLAKDEQGAQLILLIAIAVSVIIGFAAPFFLGQSEKPQVSPEVIRQALEISP